MVGLGTASLVICLFLVVSYNHAKRRASDLSQNMPSQRQLTDGASPYLFPLVPSEPLLAVDLVEVPVAVATLRS